MSVVHARDRQSDDSRIDGFLFGLHLAAIDLNHRSSVAHVTRQAVYSSDSPRPLGRGSGPVSDGKNHFNGFAGGRGRAAMVETIEMVFVD